MTGPRAGDGASPPPDARSAGDASDTPRGALPTPPRARALSPGDRRALGFGVALALAVLVWFTVQLSRTVLADRSVTRGAAPVIHTGH